MKATATMMAGGLAVAAALAAAHAAPPAAAPSPASVQSSEAGPPPASVWAGAYTPDQARRGEAIYRQECSTCHGQALTGNGEEGAPLSGPTFTSNWNGLTVGDIFERIRITMPTTRPGKLTRQQNADVLAFILSVNKFPAGKAELPPDAPRLKLIRFEATKP